MNQHQGEEGESVAAAPGEGASAAASRFDIAMAGLRLILPEAVPCEYFSQAIVYPVPRAPRRLLGMMHLRGHAVPVFDTQADSTDLLPIVQRCQLIVLRASQQAVGLICDRPPRAVMVLAELKDAPKPLPLLDAALLHAYQVSDEDRVAPNEKTPGAWSFDLVRLIECCLAETDESQGPPAPVAADTHRPDTL